MVAAFPTLVDWGMRGGLARSPKLPVDGEVSELMTAAVRYKEALMLIADRADGLRQTAVMRAVEILTPEQTVSFLAGVAKYQLGMRSCGCSGAAASELQLDASAC
ncbi:hypothetical protein Nepgr_005070 [Nepenthes gracilis]|uniref:Uncharacterized protein n=1 Tax=Nepenthes gracilis TaxID=150966 RepID=A0AAD3S2Z8_NEPGR|nr:hypothetical protein Nepgr_005070 [Nepenthes gracilis]